MSRSCEPGLPASATVLTRGFSLIEVLAVVALISVVMFVALNFYTDLARATTRASEHTHDIRRAVTIMDRVARDFESAMLVVKPAEVDPNSWPWLFVGESESGGPGADHVKFVTRNHDPTLSDSPESDLSVIAYTVEEDASGLLSLYRWSSPQLPEELDRDFPFVDDEGSHLMADGLESFGIEFIAVDGESSSEWDSTTLIRSSTLPAAVEISIALPDAELDEDTDPTIYQRLVLIRVPPIDLEQLLDPTGEAGGGDDDDEEDKEDKEDEDGDDDPDNDGKNDKRDKKGSGNDRDRDASGRTFGNCLDISGLQGISRAFLQSLNNQPWDPSVVSQLPAGTRVLPGCS